MAYCWIKRRPGGRTFYLYHAKAAGLKPFSLRTSDISAAREIQRRTESAIWAGVHGVKRRTTARIRYSDLVKRFAEHKRAAGICTETLSTYVRTFNALGAFLGSDVFADSITSEMVEGYITLRRNSVRQCDGRPPKPGTVARPPLLLKPKTIRNEAIAIAGLFKWALTMDLLTEDIMRRVSRPRRVVYDAPRALTADEFLKLKAAITDPVFADLVDFYLLSGIRRSDGLRVTSDNFDFERMVATLPQHKQGTHKSLPISPDLKTVVQRIIERVGGGKPFVQVNPCRLTEKFRDCAKCAGLPPSITFHSLRHTFGTWLAGAGVPFREVQSLLGHASAEASLIYCHSFNANRQSAIEKLTLPIPRKVASA